MNISNKVTKITKSNSIFREWVPYYTLIGTLPLLAILVQFNLIYRFLIVFVWKTIFQIFFWIFFVAHIAVLQLKQFAYL